MIKNRIYNQKNGLLGGEKTGVCPRKSFLKHEIHKKNETNERIIFINNFFVNFAYFVFFVLKKSMMRE
jgi:hypothetical protein